MSDVDRVCASKVPNTPDETVEGSVRPSKYAIAIIKLCLRELFANEGTNFPHKTRDKNDLNTTWSDPRTRGKGEG